MFGIGMSELLVILVVALLFLGPDKLPDAAKKLSQGIREFRAQGRELQRTIQDDTELGEAVRDLKSALRGDSELGATVRDLKSTLRGDDFRPVPYRQDGKKPPKPGEDVSRAGDQPDDQSADDRAQPATADPYRLAAADDDDPADRGRPEPETATAAEPASPAPSSVPVEIQSSRRGAGTGHPDGTERS